MLRRAYAAQRCQEPTTAPAQRLHGCLSSRKHTRLPQRPWVCQASTPGGDSSSAAASSNKQPPQQQPTPATPAETAPASKQQQPKWSFMNLLPPASAVQLLTTAIQTLRANFWAVLIVYLVKDGAAFLLHRFSQRLTNMMSDGLLGTNLCSSVNPWWLHLESGFLESNPGYQVCIVLFFLLALPLNILLSSAAATATAMLAVPASEQTAIQSRSAAAETLQNQGQVSLEDVSVPKEATDLLTLAQQQKTQQADSEASSISQSTPASPEAAATAGNSSNNSTQPEASSSGGGGGGGGASEAVSRKPGLIAAVKKAVADIQAVRPQVQDAIKRVWWVDCLFNMRALPLQALSLLVLPLPWTVPRLLAVQLAVPVAILEGKSGKAALERSGDLMSKGKELMAAYGWPFVLLILMVRMLDGLRNIALAAIPVRWWQDVVEVPLIITAAFAFAKLLIIRLQDLLPLAAYLSTTQRKVAEDGRRITLPMPPMSVPTI